MKSEMNTNSSSSSSNMNDIPAKQKVGHNTNANDQGIKVYKGSANAATAILTSGAILGIVVGLIWYNSTDKANRKRLFKKMKYYNEDLSSRFK